MDAQDACEISILLNQPLSSSRAFRTSVWDVFVGWSGWFSKSTPLQSERAFLCARIHTGVASPAAAAACRSVTVAQDVVAAPG
jgi:hypothetical protein